MWWLVTALAFGRFSSCTQYTHTHAITLSFMCQTECLCVGVFALMMRAILCENWKLKAHEALFYDFLFSKCTELNTFDRYIWECWLDALETVAIKMIFYGGFHVSLGRLVCAFAHTHTHIHGVSIFLFFNFIYVLHEDVGVRRLRTTTSNKRARTGKSEKKLSVCVLR